MKIFVLAVCAKDAFRKVVATGVLQKNIIDIKPLNYGFVVEITRGI